VRSFGATGEALESKLGEPIEVLPEKLDPSDEEYRRQTQEMIGQPVKGKGKGGSASRVELKGESLASQFGQVGNGKVIASALGYRLGADPQQVAVALNKLKEPVSGSAHWTFTMKAAEGFGQSGYYSNGFFAFGDGTGNDQLVKCGVQFIQGIAIIFEGALPGKGSKKIKLEGDLNQSVEVEVSVNLEKQEVVLKAGGQTVKAQLKRKLDLVTHIGFASWNSVTDFSAIK